MLENSLATTTTIENLCISSCFDYWYMFPQKKISCKKSIDWFPWF